MTIVDKVVVMNLEKRVDKLFFVAGALKVAGFPIDLHSITWADFFVRSISYDADLYANAEAVCSAAAADGFEWLLDFYSAFDPEKELKYLCAWAWTWASTLRKITELDETVMLLIDDTTPAFMWTYERYNRLASECAEYPDFKALQLRTQADRLPYKLPAPSLFSSLIGKGFMGMIDQGLILNRVGAELLLEAQSKQSFGSPGWDMMKITQWGQEDKKFFNGFYHTLDHVVDVNYDVGDSNLVPNHLPEEKKMYV